MIPFFRFSQNGENWYRQQKIDWDYMIYSQTVICKIFAFNSPHCFRFHDCKQKTSFSTTSELVCSEVMVQTGFLYALVVCAANHLHIYLHIGLLNTCFCSLCFYICFIIIIILRLFLLHVLHTYLPTSIRSNTHVVGVLPHTWRYIVLFIHFENVLIENLPVNNLLRTGSKKEAHFWSHRNFDWRFLNLAQHNFRCSLSRSLAGWKPRRWNLFSCILIIECAVWRGRCY